MGEDFGPWRPQPNFNRPSPNPNPSGDAKPDLGQSVYMKPINNMAFMNGFSHSFGIPEAPNLPMGQASEPRGWFYCLPRFRQVFAPCPRSDPEEKLRRETAAKPGPETKKFLVVDRSGDQTTVIFSSGAADTVRCLGAWKRSPEECAGGTEKRETPKRFSEPISFTDETGTESEMREDTEELDALLYSDDDESYSSEDEVTSTCHMPSMMTSSSSLSSSSSDDKQEEGFSSAGSAKKRKLSTEPKPKSWFESEDDAESSCGNEKSFGSREIDFTPTSNKRIKKEKIRETVGILQTIIPDGQGKDAIVVLDEAIQYLKSLKVKAKALGLDAL